MERTQVIRNEELLVQLQISLQQKKDQPHYELATSLLAFLTADYSEREACKQAFLSNLDEAYGEPVSEWSHADRLWQGPLQAAIVLLFGEDRGTLLLELLQRRMAYPYSTHNYYRKGYRSTRPSYYLDVLLTTISYYYSWIAYDFTLEEYLTRHDRELNQDMIMSDLLARELDHGNTKIIEALRDILFGDNQGALLTRAMIRGIVQSHNQECYEMLGRLLVAAKLQEGLRQHIMESLDEGTVSASVYLLQVVLEHNLERFSAVIRALDTWTGLGFSDQKPAVIRKCLELALRALTDSAYREEAEQSQDVLVFYFALWAESTHHVDLAAERVRRVLAEEPRYKKLAALYFLNQINLPNVQHEVASAHLPSVVDDLEQVAWIMRSYYFNHQVIYSYNNQKNTCDFSSSPIHRDLEGRKVQFAALLQVLNQWNGEQKDFEKSVFPWSFAWLRADELLRSMMTLAAYDENEEMIDALIDHSGRMDAQLRHGFLINLIGSAAEGKPREHLLSALSDKSTGNREAALKLLGALELSAAELDKVTALLKLKTGTIRQSAIQLLMQQEDEPLQRSLKVLLSASNEQQRLAGLTLAESLQQHEGREALREEALSLVKVLDEKGRATSQEQVLIDKLLNQDEPEYSAENGYGLYTPGESLTIPLAYDHPEQHGGQKSEDAELQAEYVRQLGDWQPEALLSIYKHFEAIIEEYRDYEYEAQYYGNYTEKVLLGNRSYGLAPIKVEGESEPDHQKLDSFPLPEIWRKAAADLGLTPMIMAQFIFVNRAAHPDGDPWLTDLYQDVLNAEKSQKMNEALETIKHTRITSQLIGLLYAEANREVTFPLSIGIYRSLRSRLSLNQCAEERLTIEKNHYQSRYNHPALEAEFMEHWLDQAYACISDDRQFEEYFFTAYASYKLMKGKAGATLSPGRLARAHHQGLLSGSLLLQEMLIGYFNEELVRLLTHAQQSKQLLTDYPSVKPLRDQAVTRIVEIESRRSDLPTSVSHLAQNIQRFEGMRFFTAILLGLGKETFQRGYVYGSKMTKKEGLSSLLKACYPAPGEDSTLFAELVTGAGLSEQRLLEAAMYAPQWVDHVQQYLAWPGLKSAAWYFHAHINEGFSAQKETEVALYSPIHPQKFNDGAFDREWFTSAYETLGSERFNMLYACAKYITDGGNSHRRAQLFADATLGKLDKQVLKEEISTSRNKDKLLSYTLLPLQAGDKREALERYEFIQRFLKESKQFGAQRRESESKVCEIALDNLARNTGYGDVNRMTWALEAEKIAEIAICFSPQDIDGVKLWLDIDEDGQVGLNVEKGGKVLKSVPAALKKHPQILALKETQKSLKDQYVRAKVSFEQAMENGAQFTAQELGDITRNPVIAPLVHHLVWVCPANGYIGYLYPSEDSGETSAYALREPDGTLLSLQPEAVLQLAHPVHLYASGLWSAFQRDLFERKIKQPFKQVFREYYRLDPDEAAAGTVSRRYAGHQVQPKRTVALLRTRLWTVDYEEGLQKVYYKENLVARMYAMADWFSPADIELPTLETVQFFHRETMEPVKLEEVPSIVFSEVMRDIDLVVSVAHAGGVDPEASHSTLEMRSAIARELLALLKVENVRIEGAHAHITGHLGEYSVHMGSGVVHKKSSGALNILPVHSQSRGRLFLPFADSDPRTAEIMSKLLLLAEDNKIKDPSILALL